MNNIYLYILLGVFLYFIFTRVLENYLQEQENFDPSLVPVSSIVTLAKVAQKLVNGNGTLTNPGNLQIGASTDTPGNLTVTGSINLNNSILIKPPPNKPTLATWTINAPSGAAADYAPFIIQSSQTPLPSISIGPQGANLTIGSGTTWLQNLNVAINAGIEGILNVKGATTVGGTLGVTGATTVGGTLGVTGATTLNTLGVTGATTLNTLGVTGNLKVGGIAYDQADTNLIWNHGQKKCLSSTDGKNIRLQKCNRADNNQYWINKGKRIIHAASNNCITNITPPTTVANIPTTTATFELRPIDRTNPNQLLNFVNGSALINPTETIEVGQAAWSGKGYRDYGDYLNFFDAKKVNLSTYSQTNRIFMKPIPINNDIATDGYDPWPWAAPNTYQLHGNDDGTITLAIVVSAYPNWNVGWIIGL